jgi:hypothetical protein
MVPSRIALLPHPNPLPPAGEGWGEGALVATLGKSASPSGAVHLAQKNTHFGPIKREGCEPGPQTITNLGSFARPANPPWHIGIV